MKTAIKFILLGLLFAFSSCVKKDECTTCKYTLKGVHSETGEIIYSDSGEYSEELEETDCEMERGFYEEQTKDALQTFIDYQHALNPRIEVNYDDMSLIQWDEKYNYTVNCN